MDNGMVYDDDDEDEYGDSETGMPGMCMCPCGFPPKENSPPVKPGPDGDLGITDIATLCAMHPDARECRPEVVLDPENSISFQWHTLQLPENSCVAPQDRHGFCGNESATVTLEIVCQALSISKNGSVQMIEPRMDVAQVEFVLRTVAQFREAMAAGPAAGDQKMADSSYGEAQQPPAPGNENPFTESQGKAPIPLMGGRRLLEEEPNPEVYNVLAKMQIKNSCTEEEAPSVESRSFSCAGRDCEVLELHTRYVGECYSMEDLPCGPMYILEEVQCFSPYEGRYLEDDVELAEVVDSACAAVNSKLPMGTSLTSCPKPEKPCPSSAFYQYSPWGECSASCNDPSCDNKAKCTVAGTRSREVSCVKFSAGVLGTSAECDEGAMEPSTDQPCEVQCFKSIKHRKVVGECDMLCGPGTRTTTFEICSSGNLEGCAAVTSTTAMVEECEVAKCDPCEGFCVASNTASQEVKEGYTCNCVCKENFGGRRCHRSTDSNAPPPGVYDRNGKACPSGVLDASAICCADKLDKCGMCDGGIYEGYGAVRVGLDANGDCCSGSSGVFVTGDFTCCRSPDDLDECGVCNGSGNTCRKSASAPVARAAGVTTAQFASAIKDLLPPGVVMFAVDSVGAEQTLSGRRLQQAGQETYGILPSSVAVSSGQVSTKFFSVGKNAAFANPVLTTPPSPAVTGTANNGVCEKGEPTGSSDCVTPRICPLPTMEAGTSFIIGDATVPCGGNGVCNPITGGCKCSAGYTGIGCHLCHTAAFYAEVQVGSMWSCSRLASDQLEAPALPVASPPPVIANTPPSLPAGPTASTPGTPPPAASDKKEEEKEGGLSHAAVAGIIVGSSAAFVMFAGIGYCFLRQRRAREVGPA
jgi:hypothetical protein